MPRQRGGRDYGPSSTGGTTKYSSRRQVPIGVPDRNSRKPVQVRPAKPAKDPGVAGLPGGLTGRGQADSMAKSAKGDPGVMGTPGGLTGRGQNNPALTDPGVMGVPGGVAGRLAPVSRSASSSNGTSSPSTYTEPGYPSFNQSYPSDWKPSRPKLDPDITHRGRSEPVRVRTKPLMHPSGGPINSFPWTTDHPLVQANLTKAAFGEPDPAPNAQDWPTYFNHSNVAARNARQHKTDPAVGAHASKMRGFKKDPASSTGKTPTNDPQRKAIIGSGRVDYGSAPGSLKADFYTDMMKAAGYYFVQDYQSQRDRLTPGYTPPEPTKWLSDNKPRDPGVMGLPGGPLGRRDGGALEAYVKRKYDEYNFDPIGKADFENALDMPATALQGLDLAFIVEESIDLTFSKDQIRDDSPVNAFKHAYWSYLLTQKFGPETAKKITDAHERKQIREQGITLNVIMAYITTKLVASWQSMRKTEIKLRRRLL